MKMESCINKHLLILMYMCELYSPFMDLQSTHIELIICIASYFIEWQCVMQIKYKVKNIGYNQFVVHGRTH